MKVLIHTEGFKLTDSIRSFTETSAWDAFKYLNEEIKVEAFLKKEGHDSYSCTLKVKVWRKNFVFKEYGPDIYTLIAEAHRGVCRSLNKGKERRRALLHKRAAKIKDHLSFWNTSEASG